MARALSPQKRTALLNAAVRAIAEVGLSASTNSIAKSAALAEGTLFTYFPTKDALFNDLYYDLKTEAFHRLNKNFPADADLRTRAQHIWTEYLRWAFEKPEHRKASVLLNLSPIITTTTRNRVNAHRGNIHLTLDELSKLPAFKNLPPNFATATMQAMQEAVLELASQETATRKPTGTKSADSSSRQRAALISKAFQAFYRIAE